MLNMIKDLINEKTNFLDDGDIIFEDATNGQIDDSIVLGEENSMEESEEDNNDEENEFELKDEDDSSDDEDKDETLEDSNNNDEDVIDSSPKEDELPSTNNSDDFEQPVDSTYDEPISTNDDIDDILNVEIDLKSNTMSDVLPVPPANAAEAVPGDDDDIMNTRIDSGFENEIVESSKNHINMSTVSENDIVMTEGFLQKIHNFFDGKSDATCKLKKLPPKLKNKVIKYNEKLVENMEYIIDRDSSLHLDPNEIWTAQEYIDGMKKKLFFNIVGDAAIKKRSGEYYGTITIIPHIQIKTYTEIISTTTTSTQSSQTDSEGNKLPGSSSSTTETTRERPEDPKLVEKINKIIKGAVDKLKKSEKTDDDNMRLTIYGEGRSYFCAVGFDLSSDYAKKLFNHIKGTEKLTESVGDEVDYEAVQKLCMTKLIDLMESSDVKYDSLNQFLEAITLGNEDIAPDPGPAPTDATAEPSADTSTDTTSEAPAENEVTAAVRDKVAEAGSDSNEPTTSKDELLKKLGNITKSLEDAKRAVMNSISN